MQARTPFPPLHTNRLDQGRTRRMKGSLIFFPEERNNQMSDFFLAWTAHHWERAVQNQQSLRIRYYRTPSASGQRATTMISQELPDREHQRV